MKEPLPENLDDWDIGTITNILHAGYFESDVLEFKENLKSDNERISRTCCAFANTKGGVIIFGIIDDRNLPPLDRIKGLDKSKDNILLISNQISNIKPQLSSNNVVFRKTPIDLGNHKEIIILKIHSSIIPHSFQDRFYKRIVGKNDFLTWQEILDKFIDSQRQTRLLLLLSIELTKLKDHLDNILKYENHETILHIIHLVDIQIIKDFMLNYSYLYEIDVSQTLYEITEIYDKLKLMEIMYEDDKELPPKFLQEKLKEQKCNTIEEIFIRDSRYFASLGIKHCDALANLLALDLQPLEKKKYDTTKSQEPSNGT